MLLLLAQILFAWLQSFSLLVVAVCVVAACVAAVGVRIVRAALFEPLLCGASCYSRLFSLRRWLALLFRQPPQGLYRRPCLYQSGDRMEIEHYEAILTYDETRLRLQLRAGS